MVSPTILAVSASGELGIAERVPSFDSGSSTVESPEHSSTSIHGDAASHSVSGCEHTAAEHHPYAIIDDVHRDGHDIRGLHVPCVCRRVPEHHHAAVAQVIPLMPAAMRVALFRDAICNQPYTVCCKASMNNVPGIGICKRLQYQGIIPEGRGN